MVLKQKLFKYGIDLYVENSQYNFDSKQDKLMFSILSSFNEFENTMRFEKGLMGKRRNLDDNKWWGGNINIGFKNDGNGGLIEDEENSKWVKNIFEWYNQGLSIYRIRERLMKIGVKTNRENSNWNTSSIRNILSNTMYVGYKKYEVKGGHTIQNWRLS
jgi:DNA invertase Pin-like site-specific DNA recombinase